MKDRKKAKVYIDGANIFYTQKSMGWFIDWKRMKKYLSHRFDILEIRYYTGVKEEDDKMADYLHYLDRIGIATYTKQLKKIRSGKKIIFKSNFDIEMTADILLDRTSLDEIILFSGDSDFYYLARKLKDLGKKVRVFSSRKMLSWELKLTADSYFFLEDLKKKVVRV